MDVKKFIECTDSDTDEIMTDLILTELLACPLIPPRPENLNS